MKMNMHIVLSGLLVILAVVTLGMMFIAEKNSVYDFQRQYVMISGLFLIIIGLLTYLMQAIKKEEKKSN